MEIAIQSAVNWNCEIHYLIDSWGHVTTGDSFYQSKLFVFGTVKPQACFGIFCFENNSHLKWKKVS